MKKKRHMGFDCIPYRRKINTKEIKKKKNIFFRRDAEEGRPVLGVEGAEEGL